EPVTRVRLAGQRTFHSLRGRNYRLFFFSQLISLTGTWMQTTAQVWLVLDLTGRSTAGSAVGLMVALQFLPMLLFGMWGGVIADRLDKRRTLIWTQSSAAVLAVALWLIVLTGVTQLWMIYVLAFLLGVVTVFDNPARQSFVIEMVGHDDVADVRVHPDHRAAAHGQVRVPWRPWPLRRHVRRSRRRRPPRGAGGRGSGPAQQGHAHRLGDGLLGPGHAGVARPQRHRGDGRARPHGCELDDVHRHRQHDVAVGDPPRDAGPGHGPVRAGLPGQHAD